MTRHSMLIRLGMFLVLILSLLAIWQLWLTHQRIDPEKAREIAFDHVKSSPYLESIDTTRVSIVRQDDTQAYVVDFAWEGAEQIRPGLWTEGYYVVVHARSGLVKDARAYER